MNQRPPPLNSLTQSGNLDLLDVIRLVFLTTERTRLWNGAAGALLGPEATRSKRVCGFYVLIVVLGGGLTGRAQSSSGEAEG